MERSVAVKRLGKLLGKSLGYRVDPNAPNAEEREAARVALETASNKTHALKMERDKRYSAILAADAEYQALHKAWSEAREAQKNLARRCHHYKFTVGTSDGMFFHVKAQGDSWEEVITKMESAS